MKATNRYIIIWLLTGCMFLFAMVIVGGVTRLTQSGLSMVDWSVFKDAVYPTSDNQWNQLFNEYKNFPEYQKKNIGYELEDFKRIFFWEYLHRLLGKLIGLIFIIPFIFFLVRKKIDKQLLARLLVLLLLGGIQGYLGWWMVKSGLNDNPDVSHYRLSVHLVFALITYCYTFWVMLQELFKSRISIPKTGLSNFLRFFLIGIFLQVIYGGFVAGLDAGKIFNTWPKMGNNWFPYLENLSFIAVVSDISVVQFIHRIIPIILFIILISFFFRGKKHFSVSNNKLVMMIILVFLVQFFFGVITLLYSVPLILGILHQIGAFALLSVTVYAMVLCRYKKSI